jgi:hypothetical protein
VILAGIFVAAASATTYTDTGTVFRNGSNIGGGHTVKIWNQSTGARGSTTTNSAGQWSFGGLVANNTYAFIAQDCFSSRTWYANVNVQPQPNNNVNGINLTETYQGLPC